VNINIISTIKYQKNMYRLYKVYILNKVTKNLKDYHIIAKDMGVISNYFNTENDIILEIILLGVGEKDNLEYVIEYVIINNDDIINNKQCKIHSEGKRIYYSEKVPEENEIYDDFPVIFIN
jgi:hypothetical protein